jgi:putative DNA primase/helicase
MWCDKSILSEAIGGVDLDGCRDKESGVIAPWAQRWIDSLNSYTEISPSETGVKIFVRGTLPEMVKESFGSHIGIEIYSKQPYFTVTGEHCPARRWRSAMPNRRSI